MGKKTDRVAVVDKIKNSAAMYKQKLVGKRFMFVFDNRYIEVIFKADNFRHLTGVNTNLSAKRFYNYARNGKLSASQIWFDSTHPYPLSARKIKHINNIDKIIASKCFALENVKTSTEVYKFGTTDLQFTLCLGKKNDDSETPNEYYIVQSLRDDDCISKSEKAFAVTHIFSRSNDESKYDEMLYADESVPVTGLADNILSMLDDKFLFTSNCRGSDKLAHKFDNVKEGVDSIMGGQVLEFKAKTIYNSGIDVGYERGHEDGLEKGREQGIEQGIEQGMKMSAIRMRESGMKTKDISYVLQTDEKKVREWIGEDERSKKRTEQDAR